MQSRMIWRGLTQRILTRCILAGVVAGAGLTPLASSAQATDTAIGLVPSTGKNGIELEGLDADMTGLLDIDEKEWAETLDQVKTHFARFGDKLPPEFARQMESFEKRLGV